jgi:hypothetical protein
MSRDLFLQFGRILARETQTEFAIKVGGMNVSITVDYDQVALAAWDAAGDAGAGQWDIATNETVLLSGHVFDNIAIVTEFSLESVRAIARHVETGEPVDSRRMLQGVLRRLRAGLSALRRQGTGRGSEADRDHQMRDLREWWIGEGAKVGMPRGRAQRQAKDTILAIQGAMSDSNYERLMSSGTRLHLASNHAAKRFCP